MSIKVTDYTVVHLHNLMSETCNLFVNTVVYPFCIKNGIHISFTQRVVQVYSGICHEYVWEDQHKDFKLRINVNQTNKFHISVAVIWDDLDLRCSSARFTDTTNLHQHIAEQNKLCWNYFINQLTILVTKCHAVRL